jgi:hypothetical protein
VNGRKASSWQPCIGSQVQRRRVVILLPSNYLPLQVDHARPWPFFVIQTKGSFDPFESITTRILLLVLLLSHKVSWNIFNGEVEAPVRIEAEFNLPSKRSNECKAMIRVEANEKVLMQVWVDTTIATFFSPYMYRERIKLREGGNHFTFLFGHVHTHDPRWSFCALPFASLQ